MARVDNNIITKGLSGKLGSSVYKQINGETFQTHIPDRTKVKYNKEQLAYRKLFAAAAQYASNVLNNPEKAAAYIKKGIPGNQLYNAALRDFLKINTWKNPKKSTIKKAHEYVQKYPDLHNRQIKALRQLISKGVLTNRDYRKINKISKPTATRELQDLVIRGAVISIGVKGAGAKYLIPDTASVKRLKKT